eukprot:CAMPEP_0194299902 /NCGR_PEP_ID=MMETSP0169-20130528/60967_1 /TAXON_ID=218684 /ORGANISM="Corethron pennatum, Strain L29A3" /LENGTH=564 /DNA_ID=CAMNT_0039050027 /DNA_START=25 /DNA_END=1716 /DNA_ORIENTATION=+
MAKRELEEAKLRSEELERSRRENIDAEQIRVRKDNEQKKQLEEALRWKEEEMNKFAAEQRRLWREDAKQKELEEAKARFREEKIEDMGAERDRLRRELDAVGRELASEREQRRREISVIKRELEEDNLSRKKEIKDTAAERDRLQGQINNTGKELEECRLCSEQLLTSKEKEIASYIVERDQLGMEKGYLRFIILLEKSGVMYFTGTGLGGTYTNPDEILPSFVGGGQIAEELEECRLHSEQLLTSKEKEIASYIVERDQLRSDISIMKRELADATLSRQREIKDTAAERLLTSKEKETAIHIIDRNKLRSEISSMERELEETKLSRKKESKDAAAERDQLQGQINATGKELEECRLRSEELLGCKEKEIASNIVDRDKLRSEISAIKRELEENNLLRTKEIKNAAAENFKDAAAERDKLQSQINATGKELEDCRLCSEQLLRSKEKEIAGNIVERDQQISKVRKILSARPKAANKTQKQRAVSYPSAALGKVTYHSGFHTIRGRRQNILRGHIQIFSSCYLHIWGPRASQILALFIYFAIHNGIRDFSFGVLQRRTFSIIFIT